MDYKRVWNDLSRDLAHAALSVCGLSDEATIQQTGAAAAEFLRAVLCIGPADRVLEIGCGIGRIGRELAPHCAEWHGTDVSGNMLRHAEVRTRGLRNVFLHELPSSDLTHFADGTFDGVYASIVFMHLDKFDVFTYIQEARRVLKPGGRAYFDTFNLLSRDGWQEFVQTRDRFPPGRRPGNICQFSTPSEIARFMDAAGFEAVEVHDENSKLVTARGLRPMIGA